jgi:hypothetical protein
VGRAPALLILSAALVAWYETAPHLGAVSKWEGVAIVSTAVLPAVFALEYLALRAWANWPLLAVAGSASALLAVALSAADQPIFSNFAKLAAVTAAGWLFVRLFEALSWVVLVAAVIPFVDAYSVWRGPTHTITEHHAAVFTSLSVAFVVPGGSSARLGLPDVFFFAVFLGSASRFALRALATWFAMVASLGITIVATTFWTVNGLPALPAVSFGLLAPNADLLWRRLRPRSGAADHAA